MSGQAGQCLSKLFDGVSGRQIGLQQAFGLAGAMHDGRVIAAAEVFANVLQAFAGQLPGQMHGHAAGKDGGLLSRWAAEVADFQAKMASRLDGDLIHGRGERIVSTGNKVTNPLTIDRAAIVMRLVFQRDERARKLGTVTGKALARI